jgi:hypothetical protein
MRKNLPPCINQKELDAELILSGILRDIAASDDPSLAMFQFSVKDVAPLAEPLAQIWVHGSRCPGAAPAYFVLYVVTS